jgi:uncharacterized protein (TIGR03067 family)
MNSKLPHRPDLDHLRRQAKSLLAALEAGDGDAIATFREHLPAAAKMTAAKVGKAGFRLADAQSVLARQTGFSSWPQLARHVDQLRALEGVWEFHSLEVDGRVMPPATLRSSRILIDGDCFRSERGGTIYEGTFNIDVEEQPHAIDFEFVSGPEAGNQNHGIFELNGDRLTICLEMTGKNRPPAFRTLPGSRSALETLHRVSAARPRAVDGRTPPPPQARLTPEAIAEQFACVPSPALARLQGEWACVQLIQNGNQVPCNFADAGRRSVVNNEIKVTFGDQIVVHALMRIHAETDSIQVDYCLLPDAVKGVLQYGIMKWMDDEICVSMASPGAQRPTDFTAGRDQTLSRWRLLKNG